MDTDFLKKYSAVIGCDEVGRGPIAGPVNACAVKIHQNELCEYLQSINVTDSKKLTDKKRKVILDQLGIDVLSLEVDEKYKLKTSYGVVEFCLAEMSNTEIDEINILQASLRSMKKAAEKLVSKSDELILIDGNKTFDTKIDSMAVIKGDSKLVSIGLASIIAKVFRDEKMIAFDHQYPGYFLKKNAGYPTKEHKLAVEKLGATPIHRKSFKGVKEFC